MISASIRCPFDEGLLKMFAVEDKSFGNGRASYAVAREEDELVFAIEAKDLVALRAVTNAITKTLSVYGKVGELIEEENGQ